MKSFTKITCILFTILLSATSCLYSQVSDSLLQSIRTEVDNETKTDEYFYLIMGLSSNEAIYEELLQEMTLHCEQIDGNYCRGQYNYVLAYKASDNGLYDKCYELGNEAAKYFNKAERFERSAHSYILMTNSLDYSGKREQALTESKKYYTFIKQTGNSGAIGTMASSLGARIFFETGDAEKAMKYFEEAEQALKNSENQEPYAVLHYEIGKVLMMSDINKAVEYLEKADSIATENSLFRLKIYIGEQLTYNYGELGQSEKAIETCLKTLEVAEKEEDIYMVYALKNRLGDIYDVMENHTMGLKYYNEVIDQCAGKQMYYALWAHAEHLKGAIIKRESPMEGLVQMELADSILVANNDVYLRGQTLIDLVDSHFEIGNIDKGNKLIAELSKMALLQTGKIQNLLELTFAKAHFFNEEYRSCINLLESLNLKSDESFSLNLKKNISELLHLSYAKISNFKKAYNYYNTYSELHDSIVDTEHQQYITTLELNTKFDKEKELIELENEKEKALLEVKQQRTAIIGLLASLGLLVGIFFYRSLKKRTNLIESQKAELETLNNTKDTLFQIIGHDLKKPTIGFRNVSKNINYLVDKGDYDRLKKLGEEVDQDAKSLYNLTDNLLAWALVQKDAINLKPTNVNASEVTKDNIDLFTGIANRKNISLVNNVEDSCLVNVDRNAMDTIMRNLLDNAIKFTPNGGTITIGNKTMDGVQSIYIEDTGIGLSNEAIQTIQNDAPLSSTQGTDGEKGSGVGLQLVKSLVAKSNGKFSIANRSEKGVMISINLPKAI